MLKFCIMNDSGNSAIENVLPSFVKTRLADLLTLSRVLIGLVIISLSFIGKDAYITVVILALIGAATDILDGRAARRYLGKNREGKLGKHDLEVDTFFVLCTIGYLSFADIVIPKAVGLGWIILALVVITLQKRKPKVLFFFEIPSILALITIAGIYDSKTFFLIILPSICAAIIINHRRILYIVFKYIPKSFLE